MITPSTPPSGTSTSAVTENDLFLMLTTLFSESRPMPGKNSWELPRISVGRPAIPGSSRSEVRSSIGSTLYLVASISHSRCSSASISGCSAARSRAWLKSLCAVVELPHVVVEGRQLAADHDPRRAVLGHRAPAPVVDAAVGEHLEVLQVVPLRRLRRRRTCRACWCPPSATACTPLTIVGSGRPAASRMVGATSMTWVNWDRTPPRLGDARRASARSCRCGCRPSATRPAWSTAAGCSSPTPSPTE